MYAILILSYNYQLAYLVCIIYTSQRQWLCTSVLYTRLVVEDDKSVCLFEHGYKAKPQSQRFKVIWRVKLKHCCQKIGLWSFLIHILSPRVTQRVPLLERNCWPFRVTWGHPWYFSGVRVAPSLDFCFIDHCVFFYPFTFGYSVLLY